MCGVGRTYLYCWRRSLLSHYFSMPGQETRIILEVCSFSVSLIFNKRVFDSFFTRLNKASFQETEAFFPRLLFRGLYSASPSSFYINPLIQTPPFVFLPSSPSSNQSKNVHPNFHCIIYSSRALRGQCHSRHN